jgi:putative glycosyltransferase (TIGR04348 family)
VRIALATPTPPESPHGNGVTARRWAGILRDLGHDVALTQGYDGGDHDVLVALHARKSAAAVGTFRAAHPAAPVVVALTGTDIYPHLDTSGVDPGVLEQAARLVVLQPLAVRQLPEHLRARARVVVQSVPTILPASPRQDCFEVTLLAHLRPVKDPLRLAAAVRLLPDTSRVQVTHLGESRDDTLAAEARAESEHNPRYTWLGPRSREEALRVLARSRALAVTSWHEGGANVVSEALAAGVPVVSSGIPGSVGLLGDDYPGYFPPGDTAALARLLGRMERDEGGCYTTLRSRCAARRGLVDPAGEWHAWARLLDELLGGRHEEATACGQRKETT